MASKTVVMTTTGAAGTGKSYARASRFLIDDFLPDYSGHHWSNFPINIDAMAELAQRKRGVDPDQTRERVHVIPPEELLRWENHHVTAESLKAAANNGEDLPIYGPWDFFADKQLDRTHIAIDEVHVYCGRNKTKRIREKWQLWLGDIRHAGATVEFLSQSPMKVAKEIDYETAVRFEFVSAAHRRDPILKIPLSDWYELLACIIRRWHETIIAHEFIQEKGRWRHNHSHAWRLDPEYFPAYDSFNKTREGGKAGQGELKQWQKRSRAGVFLWFFLRHPWRILGWSIFFAFCIWLLAGGGGILMHHAFNTVGQGFIPAMKKNQSGDKPGAQGNAQMSPHPESEQQVVTTQPVYRDSPETLHQLQQLQQQVETSRRDELARWSIILMTPDALTFRSGYTYHIEQPIDFGPYKGRMITEIDYDRRIANLDDGTILRMGPAFRLSPSGSGTVDAIRGGASGVLGPLRPSEIKPPPSPR